MTAFAMMAGLAAMLAAGDVAQNARQVPPPKALADLVYAVASDQRASREGYLLSRCAKASVCAQGCEATLRWLEDYTREPKLKEFCPAMRHLRNAPARERVDRAVKFVLERIRVLGEKLRSQMDRDGMDRLDCGLARLGLARRTSDACARADARDLFKRMGMLVSLHEGKSMRWHLARFCGGIEGCSGDCARLMEEFASVDWSQVGAPDWDRMPAVMECPEIRAVLKDGPPKEFEIRAQRWVQQRFARYAREVCGHLEGPAERAEFACALSRLGFPNGPSSCGPVPPDCQSRFPSP